MTTKTPTAVEIPTVPGTPFEGGFYVGRFRIGAEAFALIVSPKGDGDAGPTKWLSSYTDVPGACSFSDGLANTKAMAEAGSDLAKSMLELDIGGLTDWYLPSRDELELLYRHLKPTTETNYGYRSGENPSALPAATYAYTENDPVQTSALAFQSGGEHTSTAAWYWSSTQYSSVFAWTQHFTAGTQTTTCKLAKGRARAVRRFKVQ
jgi:hypothetical protein